MEMRQGCAGHYKLRDQVQEVNQCMWPTPRWGKTTNEEEEESWLARDPLAIARQRFCELGLFDPSSVGHIEEEVRAELDHAVKFARESPAPDPSDALCDVFA